MDPRWQNLSDPIFHCAHTRPDAPALIEGPETLSYRMLASLVARATVYLHELGIAQGQRVGVALTNSIDHVVLQFALLRIGATLVELGLEESPEALAATAQKYGVAMVFTEAHVAAPPQVRHVRVDVAWRSRLPAAASDHRCPARAEELSLVGLTTGSTGIPSGWILSQRDIFGRVALFAESRYPRRDGMPPPPGKLLLVLPLRFIWSINSVLVQFAAGGPVILLPEYARGADLLRAVASWDDAIISVTPNTCRLFLRAAPERGLLLPRLRGLETAGQPLYGEEKRAVLARVTPNFHERYGTTAGGFITTLDAAAMIAKPDSVGVPVPGMAVEVVGPSGASLPSGVAGEVRCRPVFTRGPCPEVPRRGRAHREWLVLHRRYRVARCRWIASPCRGGVEVFAPEIEAALVAHPAVADAAVIGLPVPGRGDEIVAFVVKRGALDHDEIARHCRERLAPGRLPDRVFYLDALPRIPGGKVNRVRLLEIAGEQLKQTRNR